MNIIIKENDIIEYGLIEFRYDHLNDVWKMKMIGLMFERHFDTKWKEHDVNIYECNVESLYKLMYS